MGEGDIAIPKEAGIAADPDEDLVARNRHRQQRNDDINQFKLDKMELAKSKTSKGRIATARDQIMKVSKTEHKASKRPFTVRIQKAEDAREADGAPEAKKVKPD